MAQTNDGDTLDKQQQRKTASFWHTQLDCAAKREEKFRRNGDDVQCRYMDDREHYEGGGQFEKRINILWANTEVQKGSLFENLGNPDVRRAFPLPGKANKTARTAALVMERALTACTNRYEPDSQIELAVEDTLLPGRGVCWIEYNPVLEDYEDEETGDTAQRIRYQDVRFKHVEWKAFRHGNGRSWDDIPWVARELLFTKSDLQKRWPEHADHIPINQVIEEENIDADSKKDGSFKRARVWEIWYKPEKIRVYVADDYPHELEREEDPYQLENFFPCPRPLYAVKTSSSLIPRPEFFQYKDQADELDRVNTRLWKLVAALKYCGIYDASSEDGEGTLANLGKLQDGEFLAYKNFQMLQAAGGLEKAFATRDLQPIIVAIQGLAQRSIELIQRIYEITGISDIMRGATEKDETATAQSIKAQFGSGRMRRKKKEVDRFVVTLYRMKAEMIAQFFGRDQLQQMTGIVLPMAYEKQQAMAMLQQAEQHKQIAEQARQAGQPAPPPPIDDEDLEAVKATAEAATWEEVSAILRSDDRRNYNIDVETDVTVFEDEQTEKQQRMELMTVLTQALERGIPAIQQNPSQAPFFKELMMFTLGGFKIGRTLEESFEDAFEQIENMPPREDPELQKVQAEMQLEERKLAMEQQKTEAERAEKAQEMAFEREIKGREIVLKEKEIQLKGLEVQSRAQEAQVSRETSEQDLALRREEMDLNRRNAEFDQGLRYQELQSNQQNAQADRQGQAEDRQMKREDMEARRAMDQQKTQFDQQVASGEMEVKTGEGLRSEVMKAVEMLSQQLQQGQETLSRQQVMIAQAIQGIAQQQDETQDVMEALIRYQTAPRSLKKDPKTGRNAAVVIGENPGDIRELLDKLQPGERPLKFDKSGRVETFA